MLISRRRADSWSTSGSSRIESTRSLRFRSSTRAVFERGSRLGAGPFLRAWPSVLMFFSRWWQIESLYRANAKYRPVWAPRYLLFERSRDLPRITLANACAEGFITPPRLLRGRPGHGALPAPKVYQHAA